MVVVVPVVVTVVVAILLFLTLIVMAIAVISHTPVQPRGAPGNEQQGQWYYDKQLFHVNSCKKGTAIPWEVRYGNTHCGLETGG
jgi:hypothetical protein